MSKYIDSEKVLAEIERLEHENCMSGGEHFCMRRAICLGNLRNIVTPTYYEQVEANLEKFDKEVTKIWGRCAAEPNDSIACLHIETFNEVARHFFELGFNARKDK